jgi:hypothetical protein
MQVSCLTPAESSESGCVVDFELLPSLFFIEYVESLEDLRDQLRSVGADLAAGDASVDVDPPALVEGDGAEGVASFPERRPLLPFGLLLQPEIVRK